ncbi:hypothetical protein BJX65DRAFT_296558 [Aspergillus insuetus]
MTRKGLNAAEIKPWSSGRVLTGEQRERKRLVNRARCHKYRDRLQKSTEAIERRICLVEQQLLKQLGSEFDTATSIKQQAFDTQEYYRANTAPLTKLQGCTRISSTCQSMRLASIRYSGNQNTVVTQNEYMCQLAKKPNMNAGFNTIGLSLSFHMSYLWQASRVLGTIHLLHPTQVSFNDAINQDALICGVLDGWNTVICKHPCCPIWGILCQIDMSIKIRSGTETRLAMLRGIHLLLLCFVSPHLYYTLPEWYRPKERGVSDLQDIVSDYFAWPELRDSLASTRQPELNDTFWQLFAKCFRFIWSHGVCDAIEVDFCFGTYKFSRSFHSCMQEVSRYALDPEFFGFYPELKGRLPMYSDLL